MAFDKDSQPGHAASLAPIGQELLGAVQVTLEARLGSTCISAAELMALKSGALVPLDTGLADHVDIFLNGTAIARGEIVAVGDRFGVRITEVGE